MAIQPLIDHQKISADTLRSAMEAIRSIFPVRGQNRTLELKKLWVGQVPPDDDFAALKQTLQKEKTWEYPILAALDLVDNRTGKIVDSVSQMRLMGIPRFTPLFGYAVNGAIRSTENQIRLKPGAYSQVAKDGSFNTQVMTAKGHNFTIKLDPETQIFTITPTSTSSANIRLLPVLEGLGLSQGALTAAWGPQIYQANATQRGSKDEEFRKFYRALKMNDANPSAPEAVHQVTTYFKTKTAISPETTQRMLGQAFDRISPELFLRATQRLLQLSRGQTGPDDRNSPVNKEIHSVDTFLSEYIRDAQRNIQTQLLRGIDKRDKIRESVSSLPFTKPIQSFFGSSSLSSTIKQTNPVEMIGETLKATLMGEGGITSDKAVSEDVRLVHGAQMGIIDPLHTPESHAIGTTVSITLGATKKGNELAQHVINLRTGRLEVKTARELIGKNVAFPRQYQEQAGRWRPIKPDIKVLRDGIGLTVPESQVDYAVPDPKGMFTLGSNLIPFINSDSGNRAMMGSKHVEQALPLLNPEPPLVQVSAGKGITFERVVGHEMAAKARVVGKVTAVTPDSITVGGEKHGVFNYFPLNEQTYLHSQPRVKVGDTVKPGDLLADTNFSVGGTLSLGKNLRAAYLPWKGGHSFEDSVVLSEDAAKKLTSLHMYRIPVKGGEHIRISRDQFLGQYPQAFSPEQVAKVDTNGLVKIGTVLHAGDPVALVLAEEAAGAEDLILARLRRGVNRPLKNRSVLWEEDFPGTVIEVVPLGQDFTVVVKTEEPARLGDKVSLRHGAKGIVGKLLPTSEMPHTQDGQPLDVLLNHQGVLGRINVGQTLESLAAKVAAKVGKPVFVDNFGPGNQAKKVYDLAKQHGLSDKEDLVDPATGLTIPDVAVGPVYTYKLNHPVRKKYAARATGPYQEDGTPTKGDAQGGVSMDMLTTYGLLAHGSKSLLKEAMALKSQANPEWWRAYRRGQTLPLPRDTETFSRFTNLLKGAGVNVERRGGEMLLSPLLDADVERFTNGEIKTPRQLHAKNLSPEKYGLFDPDITGGLQGEKWGHFQLAEPMPHPTFEEPIRVLTGMTQGQFQTVLAGKAHFDPKAGLNTGGVGVTGGAAIKAMLQQVNVEKELTALRTQLPNLNGTKLDQANKKFRFLDALQKTGKKPQDFVVTKIPVLPPKMRPVYPDQNGNMRHSDLNFLYRDTMLVNQALGHVQGLPESEKATQRLAVYDAMKALTGLTTGPVLSQGQEKKGLLEEVAGDVPKYGYFQRKLLKRRQDLSAKSTIVVAPEMGIDEVGLPEEMCWTIFRERGIRELVTRGKTILDAQADWEHRTPLAQDILRMVLQTNPVLLNRAPSLHKFSIQAFNPVMRQDRAIGLHPLNVKGFNADFDGDNMFVHVPVLPESIAEAKRLLPSQNLFNPRDNALMVMPDQEAVQGLYLMTREGRVTQLTFSNTLEAESALTSGRIRINDIVQVAGKRTTAGRLLINDVLPQDLRDLNRIWTKPVASQVLTDVAHKHPKEFPTVVNRLKDLGNKWAYFAGATLGVSDLLLDTTERDKILHAAEQAGKKVDQSKISHEAKQAKKLDIYQQADKQIAQLQKKLLAENPHNQIAIAAASGSKGKPDQIKQMIVAPVLFDSGKGSPIPTLIKNNLAEGLDPADYFISLFGARKGMIDKTLSTAKPGEMTKAVINALGKYVIAMRDCGTKRGSPFLLADPNQARDAVGHLLAEPVDGLASGTVLQSSHIQALIKDKVGQIKARTPLICEAAQGICSYCYGIQQERGQFPPIGTNVGAIAAHSIGEPGTQSVLKSFHTAGVSSAANIAGVTSQFDRIDQILSVPKTLPFAATLAEIPGTVHSIAKAPAGGFHVKIGDETHFVRPGLDVAVSVGQKVGQGDVLSTGNINPHDLLRLKGPEAARAHIASELHQVYNTGGIPIRKVHADIAARAMTNFGHVVDPGDDGHFIPGDIVPASKIEAQNQALGNIDVPLSQASGRTLASSVGSFPSGTLLDDQKLSILRTRGILNVKVQPRPTLFTPILTSVAQAPLKSTDWLSRLGATNLKKTILEGAAKFWRSSIHGPDPVPGLAVGSEFGDDELY
jgi:DNA-directed RNA polymerase subunit beta'